MITPLFFAQSNNGLLPKLFRGIDENNIQSVEVVPILIGNIIQALLLVGGVLAVIMIVWAGLNYVVSQGDPGRTKDAKNTILYAVVGLILSAGAYLVVDFILSRFN